MLLLFLGFVFAMTVARLLDMNAFLDRFHNYILPFLRGDDGVCSCICGRSRVDHVIPYNGDQSGMDLMENYFVSERVTRQELDMMLGLLLGVCACCLLLWLNGALQCVFGAWPDQLLEGRSTGVGSWSWLTGLSDLGSWYRWMHQRQVDDSTRSIVHVKQTLYRNGHPSMTPRGQEDFL